MEELAVLFSTFHHELESEISEFYKRFYTFTLDLLEERFIHLSKEIFYEKEETIEEVIEKIIGIINLAFMTIDFPKKKLTPTFKQLKKIYIKKAKINPNCYKDFEKDLRKYIEKILLEILIEYLFNIDTVKIQKLYLFDLLPKNFIDNVDKFKQEHEISSLLNSVIKEEISKIIDYINPSDFSIDMESIRTNKQIAIDSTKPKLKIQETQKTFLDYLEKFIPLKADVLKKFKIERDGLINFKMINQEFFDLQNLFYFISTLKMLNIEFPFKSNEVIYILKNYINGKIFSSSLDAKPDPISNYYGLTILSELNLLKDTEIINISDIQMYLESELRNFIPEKLHLNFYTILCLKVLEQVGGLMALRRYLINPILNLDVISNTENFNHILDIFEQLAILKLLDKEISLNQFKFYAKKLKKVIMQNSKINITVTDSARILLIFDLLNLKKIEIDVCNRLFKFITDSTIYFDTENLSKHFNWKKDQIAFTIELRMLFWALLASSQYENI